MKVGIIGAGISGLSVAFLLKRRGIEVEILEAAPYVGGFAHSFKWNGHICDWAAHRLFTHDDHILQQLLSLVPMNRLERTSAVYLGGKWLKDPVDVIQLCTRFFPAKTLTIPGTYLARPRHLPETSFENYCYARFGRALGDFLFSPYTVKMFGIPADQISVEWARKKVRIAGPLDVIRQGSKKKFNYFYYPKQGGYGSIADRLYADVKDSVRMEARVTGLEIQDTRIAGVRYVQDGQEKRMQADLVVSTIPLTELCGLLGHKPPLTYRAVSAIYLLINKPQTSPNHWIYFMDGGVVINRLCEVKNMDPHIGPAETSVICAEVTDHTRPDIVERAIADLSGSGLFRREEVLDTTVVKRDYSYPVYRRDYERDVDAAREHLARFSNLRYLGRAAQFEHMEVDDCFAAALQLVRELTQPDKPVEVRALRRAALPVEPQVAVIVADMGNGAETLEALASVAASDYGQFILSLVTSSAALGGEAARRFPAAEVLEKPEGMGVPASYNLGCIHAIKKGADFVLLIQGNTIVEKDLVSQLVRVAQRDPEAGVLTPKILDHARKDRIWSIGSRFRSFPPAMKNIGRGRRDDGAFAETREVDFAASCGLFVKAETLEKTGLFDPGYAFYYEDIDFSMRARAQGFRVRFVPEARMYHREMAEWKQTPEFHYAWGQSFTRFYRRHMRPFWIKLPAHLAYLVAREALTGNARNVPPLLRGLFDGLHKRIGDIPRLDANFV